MAALGAGESPSLEHAAMDRLKVCVQEIEQDRRKYQELLAGPGFQPENPDSGSGARLIDPEGRYVPNTGLSLLLREISGLTYTSIELCKRCQSEISVASSAMSTSNDMTVQCRATLKATIDAVVNNLLEFRALIAGYYHHSMELGRRLLQHPGLELVARERRQFLDAGMVRDSRMKLAALLHQYDTIGAFWKNNHETLSKLADRGAGLF